jgi:hypothetical protein
MGEILGLVGRRAGMEGRNREREIEYAGEVI